MKLLRFNESDSYFNAKSIIDTINDICLDLKDEGIIYRTEPSNDIRIKLLGLYLNGISMETIFYVRIISIHGFINKSEIEIIINTLNQLENYIKSEGLTFKYELYFVTLPLPQNVPTDDDLSKFVNITYIDPKFFEEKRNPIKEIKIHFCK
jgi:hypothetical protein